MLSRARAPCAPRRGGAQTQTSAARERRAAAAESGRVTCGAELALPLPFARNAAARVGRGAEALEARVAPYIAESLNFKILCSAAGIVQNLLSG